MNETVAPVPKTKAEALRRINTLLAGEAINRGVHLAAPLERQTNMPHWMFRACHKEAIANGWPMANDHMVWTSGDTALKFLDQLDLPD